MSDVALVMPWRPSTPEREATMHFVHDHLLHALGPVEVVLADDDHLTFNRGRALNLGVARTSASVLVLADADLWVPTDALQRAVANVDIASYVVPFRELIALDAVASERIVAGTMAVDHDWRTEMPEHIELDWPRRSTGGLNVLRRDVFDAAGGFDPRFVGWGYEDSAFDIALSTLVGPPIWLDACAVHLWHPVDATRHDSGLQAEGLALCRRYEEASGDADKVRTLIEERAA